ncbi:hypothetical protein ACTXPX_11345 [Glutamicibacter arilaitensis]|uniref:hypothetical protein n=1 Tax=Glutamicibacter arilaitensis TaxID=256701 RepID=UPI003FD2A59F
MDDKSSKTSNQIRPGSDNLKIHEEVNESDESLDSVPLLQLVEIQRELISSLLDSSRNSSSAYKAALEMKDAILQLELNSKISLIESEKNLALKELNHCTKSNQRISTERNEYLELLTTCKKEISRLTIERGAIARENKRISLENKAMAETQTKLAEAIRQKQILTIERGRYARDYKALKEVNKVLENKVIEERNVSKKRSDELKMVKLDLSETTNKLNTITTSRRYKFSSLLGNNGRTFLGSLSLVWKIPRFLFKKNS